ncbi:MAG: hypothetical protein GF334_05165 [Candidatus Altiarchaeales archaeon]|nr:hypothetical protein [Candidatus Altiarchaeales archaeon]
MTMIQLKNLEVSNRNVRQLRDDEDVEGLAKSIVNRKLISKIVLRPSRASDGTVIDNKYEVVAGQRRYMALVKIHGEDYILPEDDYIYIEDLDDKEAFLLSLEENVYRKDLTPMELNKAAVELNHMGFKDKEVAERLNVTPHRLKRLYVLSQDKNRIPPAAIEELQKPREESKFTDAHWQKLRNIDDEQVVKDVVDFIIDKECPPRDVPTVVKGVEKRLGVEKGPLKESSSSTSSPVDDGAPPNPGGPIKYSHKGELIMEEYADEKVFRIYGKEEEEKVDVEHYMEYLRHPAKFRCFVDFKLTVKPQMDSD